MLFPNDMGLWVCPKHGQFNPTLVYNSNPPQAECPKCLLLKNPKSKNILS